MGAVIATMISYFVVWLIITYDTNKAMNLSLNISRIVISVILLCVQWWLLVILKVVLLYKLFFNRYYSLTWSNNLWINKKDDRNVLQKLK